MEFHCGQAQCFKSECYNCNIYISLRDIEVGIDNLRVEISEISFDNDTWSYTIMGNKGAEDIWGYYISFLQERLTEEDYERLIPKEIFGDFQYPDDFVQELIARYYYDFIELVSKLSSRLAYQVLGVFLMKFGCKMPHFTKILILENSQWDDEKYQFTSQNDKRERKKYLKEFRRKIREYKEGIKVEIPWGSFSSVKKMPIDYMIS